MIGCLEMKLQREGLTQAVDKIIALSREGRGVLAEMAVAATPERVWRVLTSFEEMPAHLSGLTKSRIVKLDGRYRLVEQTARASNSLLPLQCRIVMEVFERRPFLYFSQRLGSFASFRGHWLVDPLSGGTGSRIKYYFELDLGQGLKRWAAERTLFQMVRRNLQELADWIEQRGDEEI